MITKTCNTCLKTLPATTDYFHKSKNHKYNLKNTCRWCCSKKMHIYNSNRLKTTESKKQHDKNVQAYRNTIRGRASLRISCIKRSARYYNKVPNSRLTLTTEEFMRILHIFEMKCAYCGISISETELVPSMIVRFSHGGSLNYQNTVISCSKCNKHKLSQTSHKSFEQWYKSQPFYSQDRYNKILNHTKESK